MNIRFTIRQALRDTWSHKALSISGILAALGDAASPLILILILASFSICSCLGPLVGIVPLVLGILARVSLIAGVQLLETQGSTTFGQSWSAGSARVWPVLRLNVLLYLPLLPIFYLLVEAFVQVAYAQFVILTGEGWGADLVSRVMPTIETLTNIALIYALLVSVVQTLGERAIVLENLGVRASIRRAWQLFRAHLKTVCLLVLVMAVISLVVELIIVGGLIAVMVTTLSPLMSESSSPVSGGSRGLGMVLIGIVVGTCLGALANGVYVTFWSVTWTLAYRQLAGITQVVSTAPVAPPSLQVA